ncbi:MAG: leucyl aminopeptidase family protein [Pseudolabrys sp.]|nr:leucyl aminopeptidase family protein [Pseudolabrys sp.]MBV9956541.1 leucyl aminopeptidase family protein [Pseudolabrys sp.]
MVQKPALHPAFSASTTGAIPIWFVTAKSHAAVTTKLGTRERAFAKSAGFEGKAGQYLPLPGSDGEVAAVLFGLDAADDPKRDLFLAGRLASLLPSGAYRFANEPHDARLAALGFALSGYSFGRYRKGSAPKAKLALPGSLDAKELGRIADAVGLARDLINTPSNDLGPAELEAEARAVAKKFGAKFSVTSGAKLQKEFPLIHAVGAGSPRAPRLIDFTWGKAGDPKVTLVGKGVCFDTGGLDIKPDSAMLNMKKDMGGAATALALAQMLMDAKARVRLRVLVPAVENSISGTSFRPRDVFKSRAGLTVEIGNTDAEGRLILADALALADEEKPELMLDFATLTGAARVALGPDVAPFFTDDDGLAGDLMKYARTENDPLWRLPLWSPYDAMLDSKIADMNNVGSTGQAGAITAALFLRRFVKSTKSWAHFDVFAWSASARPGRPEGGDLHAARALYALLMEKYG